MSKKYLTLILMSKNNYKTVIYFILVFLLFSLSGCTLKTSSTTKLTTKNNENQIKNLSAEKIEFSEILAPVSFDENDTIENIYYKRTSINNKVCFVVKKSSDNKELSIPMDNTVIYYTNDKENKIEKVNFSYEQDGKKINVEQYRLYLSNK